jgi:SAM-dependent methyltransferase
LDSELSPQLPDARLRDEMAAFYRTNLDYARQQVSHPPAYFDRLLSVMNDVVTAPGARILEIGSGSAGALHSFLRGRPKVSAVALDLSPLSLRAAAENAPPRLRLLAGTALQLPLRDGSVDAVVAFEVIEHLPDVAQALDEALRVLRRPGHVIVGLPNHASLWTPLQDAIFRRDRRAFGVERGRGAGRWWRRNARLAWKKRLSARPQFLYRRPALGAAAGGDADAVYYAAPVDLLRFFENRRAELVSSSVRVRLGRIGSLVPVELQGSTVLAWRVTAAGVR